MFSRQFTFTTIFIVTVPLFHVIEITYVLVMEHLFRCRAQILVSYDFSYAVSLFYFTNFHRKMFEDMLSFKIREISKSEGNMAYSHDLHT